MENIYDPVKQPTLYFVASTSKGEMVNTSIEALLGTLRMIDLMAERVQEQFIDNVCTIDDSGQYLNTRGDMLRELVKAVRRAGVRIEQVPTDLRDDVLAALQELGAMNE